MKTIPPTCPEPEVGPKYWRSLDQLADAPEFRQWVDREFPQGAGEFEDPVSRRHFVKIMSASFLLAGLGLTGCRRPEEKILPFSKVPEGYTHGLPQYYATSRPTRGSAVALLVKSNDGRPGKIEGNPGHPAGMGGTDAFTQASLLNLYDPDRAMRFAKNGQTSTRADALEALAELSKSAAANGGEGLSFLLERSNSPSRQRLQKLIADKFPKAKWFAYEAVDFDIHRQAASLATNQSVRPDYDLSKAKRVVSLDCDFIGSEENSENHIRGFAKSRKLRSSKDDISRLYAVEGMFTLTGANADHRLRIAPSQVLAATARLAVEILGSDAGADAQRLGAEYKGDAKWITECAADLVENGAGSVVLAGYRQPLAVHLLAHAINAKLGATALSYLPVPADNDGSLVELAKDLNAGAVETLVILGGNPGYSAPSDLEWSKTQGKAKTVIRLGYSEDETFDGCTWHLPQSHYLEAWGDARTSDGTYVSIQPMVEPLFGGISDLEVLARIAGLDSVRAYDVVRDTFKEVNQPTNFEEDWKKLLHDGFWAGTASKPASVDIDKQAIASGLKDAQIAPAPTAQSLEVVFHRDAKVDDGRYNNNGWLQEVPDPITKLTWENVVLLSAKTALALGLKIVNKENNQLFVPRVKIAVGNRTVEGPAWIQPGMADNVVALALGYGRPKAGRVGQGSGFNAYVLRTSDSLYTASGAKVTATGEQWQLSTTQDHGSMEGRPVIREANLDQYQKNPQFTRALNFPEAPVETPIYPNPLDEKKKTALHQWGMAIDLNSCVGCTACVIACQSENNIPIVGKEQVGRNREMHWLRLDRYYSGWNFGTKITQIDAQELVDEPQMVVQPMFCQHCESAPCESVCPVNATSHDEEGLNVMTYNRCVGTRYCSNNCPFKVRRYNFLDFNKRTPAELKGPFYPNAVISKVDGKWGVLRWFEDPSQGFRNGTEWDLLKLAKNPDVTVRMRGVMEKCSLCLQRIEQAKIAKKVAAGPSGEIRLKESEGTVPKTACQQACAADAIVFGDISDPESEVSLLKANERNYSVLEFLAVKPRVTYLAKVRNPNPKMPDYKEYPLSIQEYNVKNHKPANNNPFESHGHGHGAEHAPEGAPAHEAHPAAAHEKGGH